MSSKLLEQKTEKHEIRMLNCDGELKADENWMSAESLWVHDNNNNIYQVTLGLKSPQSTL